MSTSKPALERPAGTITHAYVRVHEEGARLTSIGPVCSGERLMVTTPDTVEPARTGSGIAREVTSAVVVVAKEHVTLPPAEAGAAVASPTAPVASKARGRARGWRDMAGGSLWGRARAGP